MTRNHAGSNRPPRRLSAVAALFLLLLCGCGAGASAGGSADGTDRTSATEYPDTVLETPREPTQTPSPDTQGSSDALLPSDADYDTLRAYYEERVRELQQSLMEERLDRYISEFEYKEKLAALQKELLLLSAGKELETTIPVSGETDTTEKPTLDPIVKPSPLPTSSYRYSLQDGQVTILEYLGGSGTVTLPSEIDGYPVVAIADGAFRGQDISGVILPDTLESIGWFAFAGCVRLETIVLPRSVQDIAYGAFDHCTHLTILCAEGSYAARWAASYGLEVQYMDI